MAQGKVKMLRPPLQWAGQKLGTQEMPRVKRWNREQLRAMRNGVYDWSQHQERAAN